MNRLTGTKRQGENLEKPTPKKQALVGKVILGDGGQEDVIMVSEPETTNKEEQEDADVEMKDAEGQDPKSAMPGPESDEKVATDDIDMNLYSRQIGAFGVETMGKLIKMKILIVGLKGIGVETAKNVILAGPASVTLVDEEPAVIEDLGSNFYLSESSVGKPRAKQVSKKLAELNSYVDVIVHSGEVNENFLDNFNVVLFTTGDIDTLVKYDKHCHDNGIVFLFCKTHGVTGFAFSDFGENFKVLDQDGEPQIHNIIDDIKMDEGKAVVYTEARHRLQAGDHVLLEEVEGANELNDKQFEIENVLKYNRFSIGEVKSLGSYTGGGQCTQQKVPKEFKFRSLEESLRNPVCEGDWSLLVTDYGKFGRSEQLHLAQWAVLRFEVQNQRLPALHSKEDADACVEIAKKILDENKAADEGTALLQEAIDESVVRKTALYARAELSGFCAYFGGVIAQEMVKFTGKYTPIRQWVHLDAFELVEDEVRGDAAPQNSRYDHQIAVLGAAIQEKMQKSTQFLVGAGALGCEYLKAFALMGIGCHEEGLIYVTDMDTIEVSNLNRQFLFRPENVGKPKSHCAAEAAKVMNPDLNVKSFLIRVGPDTEDSFDDDFWDSLTGVVNALDNVMARKYVDSKVVFHQKSLLESGTLGTKANSQVVLPHLTQSYGDSEDPEEDAIPMCTLRNFPHLIEHCIEWGRAEFSSLFSDGPQEANSFLKDSTKYFEQLSNEGNAVVQREKIEIVKHWVDKRKGASFETCVDMAFKQFHKQYRDRIKDLIKAFPADAKVTKDGVDKGPFWTKAKRFPSVQDFDIENSSHMDYVVNAANIFAFNFKVKENRDVNAVKEIIKTLDVPEYVPSDKEIEIEEEEEEEEEEKDDDAEEAKDADEDVEALKEIKKYLLELDLSQIELLDVADFEKDDDSNFHIDFITACANLRAKNYKIKIASRHKCKMIAGKIIPALATTTAMITGLLSLEMYKLALDYGLEKYKNAYCNLGIAQIINMTEPVEPKRVKSIELDPATYLPVAAVPEGFTSWDTVVVDDGDLTVEAFLEALTKAHHEVKAGLIYKYGITDKDIAAGKGVALYNANQYLAEESVAKNKENLKKNLKELYIECYGPLSCDSRKYLVLDAQCEDKEGTEAHIPKIKYIFAH